MNWKYIIGKNVGLIDEAILKSGLGAVYRHYPFGKHWMFDLIRTLNFDPKLIIDAGANIGSVSKELNYWFPSANIFAFEPVKSTFDLLVKQTKNISNLYPKQLALGANNEKIELALNAVNTKFIMKISNFKINRPIKSYAIFKRIINSYFIPLIRNKIIFVKDNKSKKYLQIGSGSNYSDNFINLDFVWQECGVDIFWDITKSKLPFQDCRFDGIYTEHCLEHIPFFACLSVLKELKRILSKDGVLRIIVPDGSIYIDVYTKRLDDLTVEFPYKPNDGTSMITFNRIFYGHGHMFIYDFETMKYQLEMAGFNSIRKVAFKEGQNANLLIDTEHRKVESVYLEATK